VAREPCGRRRSPSPLFSQLHILKGFKSCVLKLRILQELPAHFAKVRILKGIAAVRRRMSNGSSEVKVRVDFNAEGAEFTGKGGRPPTPGYPRVMK
jgi:hypothetical protein